MFDFSTIAHFYFILVWLITDVYAFCLLTFPAAAAQAQAEERRSLAGNSPAPTSTAATTKSHAKPGICLYMLSR